MFEFLKRKKKQESVRFDEKAFEVCEKESAAFFKADSEARKAAGLENKIGYYTFTCPNCGSQCKGEWVRFDHLGSLHGRTDCFTCDIHLIV